MLLSEWTSLALVVSLTTGMSGVTNMAKKFLYVDSNGVYTEANSFETTDFVDTSAGAGSAGLPVVLNGSGVIDGTMINDGDIDHDSTNGAAASTVHTAFPLLDGTRQLTGKYTYSTPQSFTSDNDLVSKKYVDDVHTGDEWFPYSALDYITDNTAVPPTEVSGDVYVLAHDGGAPNAAWDGASAGDIVRFNGTTWDATTPTTGTKISIDDETDGVRLWAGSSWDQKFYESTTASTGLTKVGVDIRLDASSAGDGIGFTAGVLNVNVDDSSIETSGDTLQVKASGITNGMLAGSISDDKLLQDYIQTSEVDGTTIEFSGGSLNVVANGINDTHIDFGLGLNQVNGADIPLADVGGYFSTDDVESALQQLGSAVITRGTTYTVGTGGVSKGDLVYVSANDTASTYGTITTGSRAIGIAASTEAATNDVVVLANDTVATGILSGATAGDVYYWDGSSLTTSAPSGSGSFVWQAGVAKNNSDLHVEVKLIKKNL